MIKDIIADQLVYTTVMLDCIKNGKTVATATGFFIENIKNGQIIETLVTNNHVIEKADGIAFNVVKEFNGKAKDNEKANVVIKNVETKTTHHPTEDICVINVDKEMKEAKLKNGELFYRRIAKNMMINDDDIKDNITAIEDVVMIGYPAGFCDEYNNKPVTRIGVTATHVLKDFNGKPEFIIDIFSYYGSSGSPIFIRKPGVGEEIINGQKYIGPKYIYRIIGVNSDVYNQLNPIIVEENEDEKSAYKQLLNLATAIKIEEAFKLL